MKPLEILYSSLPIERGGMVVEVGILNAGQGVAMMSKKVLAGDLR